ncbi:MAG: YdeI/OmpD-associated family protein [Methanomassiliicoccaceae archaeon]|nr:YdeI/OmpD-associated family protein [Methanomassiliicoccaceae archaeon]
MLFTDRDIRPLRFRTRAEWREWLQENHDKEIEVWFTFPLKSSGEKGVSYNDAVEEALCFGWIDSTIRSFDEGSKIQRFTPRRPGSTYSQSNKERLAWLMGEGLVHEAVAGKVSEILKEEFVFPKDIMEAIEADDTVLNIFHSFSEPYKRIRVAYVDAARIRPEEFSKRLKNLIETTRKGKMVPGYGGIDKYY